MTVFGRVRAFFLMGGTPVGAGRRWARLIGARRYRHVARRKDKADCGLEKKGNMSKSDVVHEPSTLSGIIGGMGAGARSPSELAQVAGEIISPPGAEHAVAQGLQMVTNASVSASKGFMEATVNQHGISPAAQLQDLHTQIALGTATHRNEEGRERGGAERRMGRGR